MTVLWDVGDRHEYGEAPPPVLQSVGSMVGGRERESGNRGVKGTVLRVGRRTTWSESPEGMPPGGS